MRKILLQIILLAISINSYCQVPRLFGNEDLKPFEEGNLYGFKNMRGEPVIPSKYDYVLDFSDGLAAVKSNDKWGYVNKEGIIVIPIRYDSANSFSEGLARVGNYINGKMMFGHINKHGQIVTPLDYKLVGNFHEGVAYVFNGSKYGFVNKYGKEITPCKYSSYIKGEGGYKYKYAPNFSEGLAVVKKGSRWVYINHQGETIVKLNKQQQPIWNGSDGAFNCFSDGVVWVIGDNLTFCILDKKGNELSSLPTYLSNIKLSIRYPQRFIGGYSEISSREKGLKLLVNKHAEIVAVYDSRFNLLEDYQSPETQLIFAKWLYENYYEPYYLGGPYYYDSYIKASYQYFKNLSELGNSYAQYVVGFMTQYGQGTEANEQEAIKWYKKSNEPEAKKQLAMLEVSKSNASIYTATEDVHKNKDGVTKNLTFEPDLQKDSFDQIPRLYVNEDDYYVKGGKAYDRQGKLVLSSDYYYIWSYSDGRFRVTSQNNLYGFVDVYGNNIIPCQYEDARDFRDGVARVCKKVAPDGTRKWGYIDKNGKQVLPFDYVHTSGDFSQGLAYAYKSNQSSSYIINKKGEIVKKIKISNWNLMPPGDTFLPKVANYTYFSEGIIWLSVGNRLFMVNTNGDIEKEIDKKEIDKSFNGKLWEVDKVYPFKRGLSLLRFEDDNNKIKIGYLYNKDGNVVAKYDFVNNKVFDEYKSDTTAIVKIAEFFYDNDRLNSAFELFRQASSLGNSRAQYVVGYMYQYGQGTAKNEQEAINWYKKSNEPGAKKQLAMLEGKDNIQESVKKEEAVLLADTKVRENKSERITQQFPVKPNTVVAETSQEKIVAQNTSQVQEQSKQLTIVEEKKEKRIALLIGNAKYDSKDGFMPLTSPENDVRDLKRALEKLGFFPTIVRTNLDQSHMEEVIQNFCDTIKNYDVALFYYSGHAFQNRGVLRLAPVNEDFSKPGHRDNAVRFDFVLNTLIDSEVKTKILILDACRSRKPFKGVDDRWTTPTNHGCFVAFATRAGENANDGEQNSVYTKALLESLNLQGDLDHIFNDVEQKVYERTSNDDCESLQLPVHNNELFPRAFYLNK